VGPGQNLATVQPREEGWDALIERTARGEEAALAALYDRTAPLVHGLALRIVGNRGAAEEVTGDVYLQVWRQAARYDRARGAPLAWLLTLARSRAIDRVRVASQRHETEPLREALAVPSAAPDPEESSAVAERRRNVQGALARLAPEQRQAIELAYFGGLSHSEVAVKLGEPLGTVKTRIRLGMMRLRETLASIGKESL